MSQAIFDQFSGSFFVNWLTLCETHYMNINNITFTADGTEREVLIF